MLNKFNEWLNVLKPGKGFFVMICIFMASVLLSRLVQSLWMWIPLVLFNFVVAVWAGCYDGMLRYYSDEKSK